MTFRVAFFRDLKIKNNMSKKTSFYVIPMSEPEPHIAVVYIPDRRSKKLSSFLKILVC